MRINGPQRILQDTDRRHTMARSNVKMIERRVRKDKRKVNDRRREKVEGILAMSLEDIVGANYISPYLDGIDNAEQAAHVNHEENADMEANAEEVEGGDGTRHRGDLKTDIIRTRRKSFERRHCAFFVCVGFGYMYTA